MEPTKLTPSLPQDVGASSEASFSFFGVLLGLSKAHHTLCMCRCQSPNLI